MNNIDKWIDEMTVIDIDVVDSVKKKIRREKTPQRKQEIDMRKATQYGRVSQSVMVGVSADINYRTGELHEHKRQKERICSQRKFVSTKNN